MSRYPNLAALGDSLAFPGRPNGFRNRRMWLTPATATWTVPDDLPIGADGYGRVKAAVIGAGNNGGTGGANGTQFSGAGGALALAYGIRCKPGDVADLTIGARSASLYDNSSPVAGVNHGNASVLELGGRTITGGSGATPNGTGGDLNVSGGAGRTGGGSGGSSGSPWGATASRADMFGTSWPAPGMVAMHADHLGERGYGTGEVPNKSLDYYANYDGIYLPVAPALEARARGWWDIEDLIANGGISVTTPLGLVMLAPATIGGGAGVDTAAGPGGGGFVTTAANGVGASSLAGNGCIVLWW